jgi:copper chaperone CopZ
MRTVLLTVNGMHCQSCVESLARQLKATSGVQEVAVDLNTRTARVDHDDELKTPELVAAVRRAGYHVESFRSGPASA